MYVSSVSYKSTSMCFHIDSIRTSTYALTVSYREHYFAFRSTIDYFDVFLTSTIVLRCVYIDNRILLCVFTSTTDNFDVCSYLYLIKSTTHLKNYRNTLFSQRSNQLLWCVFTLTIVIWCTPLKNYCKTLLSNRQ